MAGPFFAIAGVLILSGASKLIAPEAAASVLASLGIRQPAVQVGAVRLVGAGEMALGTVALVFGGAVVAGAVAVAYACFAAVSEWLRRQPDAVGSCGCFGAKDTPPSLIHTGVNVAAGALAVLAVVWPAPDLLTVLGDQPALGLPFVGLTALAGYLFYLAFTVLPEVFAPPAPPEVPLFGVRS